MNCFSNKEYTNTVYKYKKACMTTLLSLQKIFDFLEKHIKYCQSIKTSFPALKHIYELSNLNFDTPSKSLVFSGNR